MYDEGDEKNELFLFLHDNVIALCVVNVSGLLVRSTDCCSWM